MLCCSVVVFLPLYIIRHQFAFCFTPSSFLCCLGDADAAADFARQLLTLGADPNLRSRWTNMRALHYAAYFDVPQLIQVVLRASQPGGEKMPSARVVSLWRRRRSFCTKTVQFSRSRNSKLILPDKRTTRIAHLTPGIRMCFCLNRLYTGCNSSLAIDFLSSLS